MQNLPQRPLHVLSQLASFHPCDDWFFVHTAPQGKKVLHRLAGWGQLTNGAVIGLESLRLPPEHAPLGNQSILLPPHLVPVPAYEGCYLHFQDLTDQERETLTAYRQGGP